MFTYLKDKKGSNIIMAIAFMIIMSVMVTGFLAVSSYSSKSATRQRAYWQAKASARGVNEALAEVFSGGSDIKIREELLALLDERLENNGAADEITLENGGVIRLYGDGSGTYVAPAQTIDNAEIINAFTIDPSKTILDIDTTVTVFGQSYSAGIRLAAAGYEYHSGGGMGAYTVATEGEELNFADEYYGKETVLEDAPDGAPPALPGANDGFESKINYALVTLEDFKLTNSTNIYGNIFSFGDIDIARNDDAPYAGTAVARGNINVSSKNVNRSLISMQDVNVGDNARVNGKIAASVIKSAFAELNGETFAESADIKNTKVNKPMLVEGAVSDDGSELNAEIVCKEYNGVTDIGGGGFQLFVGESPFANFLPPQPGQQAPLLMAPPAPAIGATSGEFTVEGEEIYDFGGETEETDDGLPDNVTLANSADDALLSAIDNLASLRVMTDMAANRADIPRWGMPNSYDIAWNARYPEYRTISETVVCKVTDEKPDYFIFVTGGTVSLTSQTDIIIDETELTEKNTGRVFICIDRNSKLEFLDAPSRAESGIIGATDSSYASIKANPDTASNKYPANLHIITAVDGSGKSIGNSVSIGYNRLIFAHIFSPIEELSVGEGSSITGGVSCLRIKGSKFNLIQKAPYIPSEGGGQSANLPTYPVFGEFVDIPDINIPISPRRFAGSRLSAPRYIPRAWHIVGRYS